MRLVLVDDHEVGRVGRSALLTAAGFEVRSTNWSGVEEDKFGISSDLVMAVVRPDGSAWDRYHRLRRLRSPVLSVNQRLRTVAIVSPRGLANPALALRLAALGIDEMVDRRLASNRDDLSAVVTGHLPVQPTNLTAQEMGRLGFGKRSDPERVVSQLIDLIAVDRSYLAAFEPGNRQNQSGLSRRRAHTLRVKVAEWGDLTSRANRTRGGPIRDLTLPLWSETVAFVNMCRGRDDLEYEDEADPSSSRRPPFEALVI